MCGNVKSVQEAINLLKSGHTLTGNGFTYFKYDKDNNIFIEYYPVDCDLLMMDTYKLNESDFTKHIAHKLKDVTVDYEDN